MSRNLKNRGYLSCFSSFIFLSSLLTFVVGFIYASTGFSINVQNLVQVVGGFLNPGNAMSNMYFTLFGYNSVNQATSMMVDLKLGQYMKLPPKVVFFCQIWGTLIGGFCNYAMTTSIVANEGPVLLDRNGNQQWSGYLIQTFNSNALTWGALPGKLYGPNKCIQKRRPKGPISKSLGTNYPIN